MKSTRGRKLTAAILAAVLVWGLVGIVPSEAQSFRYWWQVTNERGRPYPQGTATCSVYDRATDGRAAHVFTGMNNLGSGSTSPLLGNRQGTFEFYWLDSTSKFDVVCWTKTGRHARLSALDAFTHNIVINRSGSAAMITRIPYHTNAVAVNTGHYLPVGALIRDVIIQDTAIIPGDDDLAKPHIEVGFRGTHAVSGNVSGLVRPLVLENSAANGGGWYFPIRAVVSTQTSRPTMPHVGLALSVVESHAVTGIDRFYQPYLVHVVGGLEVTYRTSAALGMNGHIFIFWDNLHLGVGAWGIDD